MTKKEKTEPTSTGQDCSIDYVRKQIQSIEDGLARAVKGEFAPVELEDADTLWGSFVMQVNVVINATRTALTRAEKFEREAAESRACERAARERTVVIQPHGRKPK